jgi:hypothetical protein
MNSPEQAVQELIEQLHSAAEECRSENVDGWGNLMVCAAEALTAKLGAADHHDWIRNALGLDESAPRRFDYYAGLIEELRGSVGKLGGAVVPDGYKLVPIEPTDVMALAALGVSLRKPLTSLNGVDVYRAMLAAAPQPAEVAGKSKCEYCSGHGLLGNTFDTIDCTYCGATGEAPPAKAAEVREPLSDDAIKLTISEVIEIGGGDVLFCPELSDLVKLCRKVEQAHGIAGGGE